MKGIQPEGLGEFLLKEVLEGEIAEDTCHKVNLIEMKGVTRLKWSHPTSEGRRRDDTHMYSPTTQGRHQRNIPPPAPNPSEDKILYGLE